MEQTVNDVVEDGLCTVLPLKCDAALLIGVEDEAVRALFASCIDYSHRDLIWRLEAMEQTSAVTKALQHIHMYLADRIHRTQGLTVDLQRVQEIVHQRIGALLCESE